jgi:hypothetical protein
MRSRSSDEGRGIELNRLAGVSFESTSRSCYVIPNREDDEDLTNTPWGPIRLVWSTTIGEIPHLRAGMIYARG